jgi:hypothetical protein
MPANAAQETTVPFAPKIEALAAGTKPAAGLLPEEMALRPA